MFKKKRKNLPLWVLIPLDILLIGAVLLSFSFFHHVLPSMRVSSGPLDIFENSDEPTVSEEHLMHVWQIEVISPTCTEEGYTLYTCACGARKEDDRTEALGHGDPVIRNALQPTDDADGYTGDEYCSVCDTLLRNGTILPPLKHQNHTTVLQNEQPASCTSEGYSGDVFCVNCNKIIAKGSVTPKTDHNYTANYTFEATCKDQGYTLYVCDGCYDKKKGDYTPIVEHTRDFGGKCSVCEEYLTDLSGQFGLANAGMFSDEDAVVKLFDDAEIRKYAEENKVLLQQDNAMYATSEKFISFYRSHDLCMAVREITGERKGSPVKYYIYDIYIRNVENFHTSTDDGSLSTKISNAEALMGGEVITAINGDYYNLNHCQVAVRNGALLKASDTIKRDVAVLYYDGRMETVTPDEYDWNSIKSGKPYQVWNFGPALIDKNGNAIKTYNSSAYDGITGSKNPRTAIGYYAPGHYCFVGVLGRQEGISVGFSMATLAEVMAGMGCVAGYNMDGGNSSQSYNMGEIYYHSSGHRRVPDILLIGEVKREDE